MLFLTPLFYYLPNAALTAAMLVAVYKLLDFKEAARVFKVEKDDGMALAVTFVLTLLLEVKEWIIAGVFRPHGLYPPHGVPEDLRAWIR